MDKERAIDLLDNLIGMVEDNQKNDYDGALRMAIEVLRQLERKTGRWILYDKRFPWSKDYKCSECGNYINLSGINGGRGDANYCPNCGAKMIEK